LVEQLAAELTPYFRASHQHHLRIPLLRRAGVTAPVTNPHVQPTRGPFMSYFKLLYLFFGYWLAHIFVTLPRLSAGHLVLFDRYYQDHHIDPRRYRLAQASVKLAQLLGKAIPEPDLQFVLDVPAEELQRRKSEVSLAESNRQRLAYSQRLGARSNSIIVDANKPISAVGKAILSTVLTYRTATTKTLAK
jgi:thymidylate kinase